MAKRSGKRAGGGRLPRLLREASARARERARVCAAPVGPGSCAPRPALRVQRAAATPQIQDRGPARPASWRLGLLTWPITDTCAASFRSLGSLGRLLAYWKLGSLVLG